MTSPPGARAGLVCGEKHRGRGLWMLHKNKDVCGESERRGGARAGLVYGEGFRGRGAKGVAHGWAWPWWLVGRRELHKGWACVW